MEFDSEKNTTEKQESTSIHTDNGIETNNKRGFLDWGIDFFLKMILGIFSFIIIKIPKFIFFTLLGINYKHLFRQLYKLLTLIVLVTIWLALVFAAWIAFAWQHFVRFWSWIGSSIWNFFIRVGTTIYAYIGQIWLVLALLGSVYGIVYITLKRRAKRKNSQCETK